MKTSESLRLIANGLAHEKNGKAKTASAGRELLRLSGKVEELERAAMLAALDDADSTGEEAERITAPNWLRHFDAIGMLIDAFQRNVTDATGCDGSFPLSVVAAWPDLPKDARCIIRAVLKNAFAEIDKPVGSRYGSYAGVWMYKTEWEKVKRLGEASE